MELGHQELEDLVVGVEERLLLLLPQANYPHQVLLSWIFSRRGGVILEINFANIQSFGPSKRSQEQKESMFLTEVTSIFLIFCPFPGAEVILEVK